MKISVKHLLVVVCLSTAVVLTCLARRRQGPASDAARQVGVAGVDSTSVAPTARGHRTRTTRAIEREKQGHDIAERRAPTTTIANEADPSGLKEAFDAFDRWLEDYVAATPGTGVEAREAEGESLALKRRSALAQLIESDPERAIRLAIPNRIRRELPASISQHLEERVSGLARLDVIAVLPASGEARPTTSIERFVTMNNRTFKASVYGRRVNQTSKDAIPLHGIAVGKAMAVHESPVRVLEEGERTDPSLPEASDGGRCPISQAAGTPSVAVQVANEVFYLCHDGHIEAVGQALEAEEAGIGPGRASTTASGPPDWTHGAKTVLVIRVNFPDLAEESISEAEAERIMRQANDFFVENSYGTMTLAATVTPLLTLPHPKSWYTTSDDNDNILGELLKHARAAAEAAGFTMSNFDLDCVHLKRGIISSSRGYVGRKGAWLLDKDAAIACHEFGHNLGLWHANAWKTSDGSVVGDGKNWEYENPFDTMGNGRAKESHFNVCYKHMLNWLPEAAVQTVTSDGVYRLYPFDVPTLADGRTYALKIRKDNQRDYWIETRQSLGTGSLVLNWSPWSGSKSGTQLLDTVPTPGGGFYDAPLALGKSFYDPVLGLKIIPLSLGGTTPESIDVMVKHVHYFTVEAESGTLTRAMSVVRDPLASQGRYILSPVSNQDSAVFTVEIPADGEYVVWCRILATQSGPISLSVSVDGESEEPNAVLNGAGSGSWLWSQVAERSGYYLANAPPKLFSLTAGRHNFHLSGGSQNTMIDSILFTDDPTTTTPPVIARISNQVVTLGTPTVSIPFTVADLDSPLSALRLTARSSNSSLVPETNIAFDGGEINRTVTITPARNQLGTASITLNVIQPGGESSSTTFSLTVIGAVQALVTAASPGDTVIVPAGSFIDRVIIDKDLTLQGSGTVETMIDGNKVHVPLTITNHATVIIRNLTLRNGRGGLRNYGTATLIQCAIRDNQTWENGGGIWNGKAGYLFLESCTVSSNRCSGNGGGIYNAGEFTASNSTISGNRATSKSDELGGGGIYNANKLTAHNSTVAQNRATHGGGIMNIGWLQIGGSIVAGNQADSQDSPDFHGELTSAGYNLIQSVNGYVVTGDLTGNIIGQDPRLGPLQDNGGATWTHALLPDSPAIDHGDGGGGDIGAFEFVPEAGSEEEALIDTQTRLITGYESNGDVTVILTNGLGFSWMIQATSDFKTWERVAILSNVTGTAQFTDTSARGFESRFYRAVVIKGLSKA